MTICRDTSERTICVFFAVFQKSNYICPQSSRAVYWKQDNNEQKNKSRYQSLPTAHFESRGFLSCSLSKSESWLAYCSSLFTVRILSCFLFWITSDRDTAFYPWQFARFNMPPKIPLRHRKQFWSCVWFIANRQGIKNVSP